MIAKLAIAALAVGDGLARVELGVDRDAENHVHADIGTSSGA